MINKHSYPGLSNPYDIYTSSCIYGCGCRTSAWNPGGPSGIDPFGPCPKNKKQEKENSHEDN